jgi:hypothetical protein
MQGILGWKFQTNSVMERVKTEVPADTMSMVVLSRYTTEKEPKVSPAPSLIDHHYIRCRLRM